jgi:OmpA-OmpF porin, OOP family
MIENGYTYPVDTVVLQLASAVQKYEWDLYIGKSFPGLRICTLKRAGYPGRARSMESKEPHPMNRTSLAICLAASMVASVGCASKNYVKQQTTPLINKTNELDDLTAKNSKDIKDVDARAQAGIQAVNAKTAEVEQKTASAAQNATQAQQTADAANGRVGVLTNTVANLDNYHAVAETSVKFGFNKDGLTPKAKEALDQLATSIATTKGYIIALEGGTDSVGPADYNYDLSQRRANSVIQYLASKYNVPAHKIYVIGLGKDKPVETNKTSSGRADNRRVDVRLMTNTVGTDAQPAAPAAGGSNPSSM